MTNTQTKSKDRLFVPLETTHYDNLVDGDKDIELRGVNSRFNERTVVTGRAVEFRRGYSHDPVWGTIGERWFFDHLAEIPLALDHERIVPGITREQFIVNGYKLLGQYDRFVAFEVDLE
jgi:hypothetical protein